jgi:hypothetical protein
MSVLQTSRGLTTKIRWRVQRRSRRRWPTRAAEVKAVTAATPIATARTEGTTSQAASAIERGAYDSRTAYCGPVHLLVTAEADRESVQLRRADDQKATSYEILPFMDSPTTASGSDAASDTADGISAFVARVLDQLSLSAWLPAAFLTASLALLLQFRADKSADVLRAVRELTADPVRVLVLIVPVLVLATVVTQAFSFEAIRTLEGYWHRRGPASLARKLMIKRQVRRASVLTKRREKATEAAWYSAESRMLKGDVSLPVVNAMKATALELELDDLPALTDEQRREFEQRDWEDWCDAWRIAEIEHLRVAEEAYPLKRHRILPTKLGNLIRATEDQLRNTEDDVEGFALRRYAGAPPLVQTEHNKFRSRLDMYCTLVFVSAVLLVLTPLILLKSGIGIDEIVVISVCFGALSEASYLAAIASARGYCSALKEMDRDFSDPS